MSSHCAALLYHFCPLTAVSGCLRLPSPPSLFFGAICGAPGCLGRAAARGKVRLSSVENCLLELSWSPKHFPQSCASFQARPLPGDPAGRRMGSTALRPGRFPLHRDHPSCPHSSPILGKDKTFQFIFTVTFSRYIT